MKLMTPQLCVVHFTHDFSLAPQAAVGEVVLGELPENFVVQSVSVQELSALTATTTIAVGPTADKDGFFIAADHAGGVVRGQGALVWDATAGDEHPLEHVLPAAQNLCLTTAVAAAITGKVAVFVQGYQAF